MKKVTILGLRHSMAITIFGPMDVLGQAGRLWNRAHALPSTPFFEVTIASPDGQPIQATNNVLIQPHCGVQDIERTDLIIIASATFIDRVLQDNPELPAWLRRQYHQGAHVASICTGVFLLAESGLLDGKAATLHWGFASLFRRKYPQVRLEAERMFLDQGRLYCSAGVSAGLDLSLYLVEKFCGRSAALQSAKTMILDLGRTSQAPYESFLYAQDHGDPLVKRAQQWMQERHDQAIDYDQLARTLRVSRRSLERRFKQAAGVTPLGYLQRLRVEAAKRLMEDGGYSFNEITYLVGYEDISFFRKLFTRLTGLRPREYQQRFAGYPVPPSRPQ